MEGTSLNKVGILLEYAAYGNKKLSTPVVPCPSILLEDFGVSIVHRVRLKLKNREPNHGQHNVYGHFTDTNLKRPDLSVGRTSKRLRENPGNHSYSQDIKIDPDNQYQEVSLS